MDFLKEIAVCPGCWNSSLTWREHEGALCRECGGAFPVEKGIWYAIIPDASWAPVLQDTISLFTDFTANRDRAVALGASNIQQAIDTFTSSHEQDRDSRFYEIWERLKINPRSRVLELGAGDLRISSHLARQGYNITAVEAVPESLQRGLYDAGLSFPRICCSGSRLPFRDQSFDVVFCQAMLHHLGDILPVVMEMARVLRPGGLFLAVTEPSSAMFRNIRRLRETTPEYSFDIGIHETIPKFGSYTGALRKAGIRGIEVFSNPGEWQIPFHLRKCGWFEKMLPKSPLVRGWRMHLRHRLVHGQVSLCGYKSSGKTRKAGPLFPEQYFFSPGDYIYRRDRFHLVNIWKRLLDPDTVPFWIVVGENDIELLRRGFSRMEREGDGFAYKWLQAQGAFFLRVAPSCRNLAIMLKQPEDSEKNIVLQVLMDSQRLVKKAERRSLGSGWVVEEWDISSQMPRGIGDFQLIADHVIERQRILTSVKIHSVECR